MFRTLVLALASLFLPSLCLAEPLISEFLTQNVTGLQDDEGETSDWIEIYNPDAEPIHLEGYSLTDSKDNLVMWRFPKITLLPAARLVVFASGREVDTPAPANPDDIKRQRLLDWGMSQDAVADMSPEDLDRWLDRIERLQRTRRDERSDPRPTFIHASFKLDRKGEYLALVKPDNKTICHAYAPKYPAQHDDVSYGLIGNSLDEVGFLLESTPGAPNSGKLEGFVKPVYLSVKGGHYSEAFDLEMDTATPDAVIRFTLDGDAPTATSGFVYTAPFRVARTTTLRAAAYKNGFKSTPVITRTYLFLDDVVLQSDRTAPPGWPNGSVAGQRLDYGMDPRIVGGEHTVAEVKASLESLPSLSIVAPLQSLFSPRSGIYVNASNRGPRWERAASVELLNHDRSKGFQMNGGLRMRGGFSRQGDNPKHGFRMLFRKEYGASKLRYPLFEDEGVTEFEKIDFRSSMNYSWAMNGDRSNTLLRDVWSRDTQRDMGQPYTRSRFYHLYLNGHYWGIYMTQERAEANYGASYFGGEQEDYDTVKTHGEVTDGNGDARDRLDRLAKRGFANDADYFRVQGMNVDGTRNPEFERLVDIDNVIDYMLITFYTGDKDGPGGVYSPGNNYFSLYNRVNPDGFKFFEHDSEHSLGLGQADMTGSFMPDNDRGRGRSSSSNGFNVHWLHTRLVENPNYITRFSERAERHLFAGGALTPEAGLARLRLRKEAIDAAMIAHSARWGDAASGAPRTREDWRNAVERIEDFIRDRNETLLQQLSDRGWYRGLAPPRFTREGGLVSAETQVYVIQAEGDIFVTTDGADPRGPDGQPAPSAQRALIPKVERRILLNERAPARALVPNNGAFGLRWTQVDFEDQDWIPGRLGMGFENKSGYEDLIGLDLHAIMHQQATSAYLRTEFQVDDPSAQTFDELALMMRYDDGFVAYLNGTQIAAANAPETPVWNAEATTDHPDDEAARFVSFPIKGGAQRLRAGRNVLAIHGMDGNASSDFIITPQLEGLNYSNAQPIPLRPRGGTLVRCRSLRDGKWSPLAEVTFTVEE